MDQFYIDIYENIIYQWIIANQHVYQKHGIDFYIDHHDPQKLIFTKNDFQGEIYFWTQQKIIEETIVDQDQNIIFYLHYRIINLAITKRFVQDFLNQFILLHQPKHIGMSCSCGITSSLFVENIQQLSQMMNLPYSFDVVSLYEIENVYSDYDMIMLAPQTSYLEPKIKAICQDDCYIMSIDASIFATSNYQQALMVIQDILE